MDKDNSVFVATAGALVTMLFVWVGLAMAHDPPAPADAAVGKGLLTLAGATAIVTLMYLFDQVDRRTAEASRRAKAEAPKPRSDRNDV